MTFNKVLGEKSGNSGGKSWKMVEFLCRNFQQTGGDVVFTTFTREAQDMLDSLKEGDVIEVQFQAESREYNGRWYTSLKCFEIHMAVLGKKKEEAKVEEVDETFVNGSQELPF